MSLALERMALAAVALIAGLLGSACAAQGVAARPASRDTMLIFEQRRASRKAELLGPDWESWQLYESGRWQYFRAGAEPTRTRIDSARLRAVHAWLRQHDYELLKNTPDALPSLAPVSDETASCQVHLSTGLVLAPLGDRRYYACDELRRLIAPTSNQ